MSGTAETPIEKDQSRVGNAAVHNELGVLQKLLY